MTNIDLFCDGIVIVNVIETCNFGFNPELAARIVTLAEHMVKLAQENNQITESIEDNLGNIVEFLEHKYGLAQVGPVN